MPGLPLATPGFPVSDLLVVSPRFLLIFFSSVSLVKIRFTDKEPRTAWNVAAPQEYGFYSNVNPDVSHPRWSQATERRIGEDGGLFAKRRKTLMFNGYEPQVGQLYAGMDLRKFF